MVPPAHDVQSVACCVGCVQAVLDGVAPMLPQQVRRVKDGSDHRSEALDAVAVERARHGEQVHRVADGSVRFLNGRPGDVKPPDGVHEVGLDLINQLHLGAFNPGRKPPDGRVVVSLHDPPNPSPFIMNAPPPGGEVCANGSLTASRCAGLVADWL